MPALRASTSPSRHQPFVSTAIRVRSFGARYIMPIIAFASEHPIVDCRRFDSRHERSPIRRERPAESRRSIVTRRFSLSVAPRSSCRRLTSLLRCRADNPDGVSSRRCNRPSIIRRRGWISALIVAVTGNGRHRRDGGRTSARARQKDNGSYRRG